MSIQGEEINKLILEVKVTGVEKNI